MGEVLLALGLDFGLWALWFLASNGSCVLGNGANAEDTGATLGLIGAHLGVTLGGSWSEVSSARRLKTNEGE